MLLIACIFLFTFNTISAVSLNATYDAINSHTSFAYQLQTFLNNDGSKALSGTCSVQLLLYAAALLSPSPDAMWAKQMFDAASKLPSGLLEGNAADLGSFDECLNAKSETSWTKPISGKYCVGTIPINAAKTINPLNIRSFGLVNRELRVETPNGEQGLQLASCLPDGCSAADVQAVYSVFGLGLKYYEKLCQTAESQPELDGHGIATISVLSVFLWLVVTATAYDIVLHYFGKKTLHPLLIAFSALTNGRQLLATTSNPNQITCMHGIRVLSMMWVVFAHRHSVQFLFPVVNSLTLEKFISNPISMYFMSATLAVDTFFVMGGVVLSYMHMTYDAKGKPFSVIMHWVHRYLRLTPVLAVLIAVYLTLVQHMGSGPFWPFVIQRDLLEGCERYWWKTLLYFQNYFNQEAICISQSWYLSVDMQLFFLSPLILIPLVKWPMFTISMTGFLAVCSSITSFLTLWFFELNQNLAANPDKEALANYIWHYYMATQTKAGPWLIGVILGYLIFECKRSPARITINKMGAVLLWIASLGILFTCIFAGHGLIFGEYNRLANSVHGALVRPAWAIALSVIIFICTMGYGGPINTFLSIPLFQVLSKLTYSMYLSHYLVIYLTTAQMRSAAWFSPSRLLYQFCGDYMFTILVSVCLTLMFESPMVIIENAIFGRNKKK